MTQAHPKIALVFWHLLPAPIRRKLRTDAGNRFMRFVPVSLAAVIASQLTLAILVGVTHVSAGTSAVIASMVGAAVSYILSRWAWERKGRPHVLKETLPFWLVAVSAWIVLGLSSHLASVYATNHGFDHWQRVAFVNGCYLVTNCVTFVLRFLIFHYVLFADRGSRSSRGSSTEEGAAELAGPAALETEPVPVAAAPAGREDRARR
jgi:putative flippase GtrA